MEVIKSNGKRESLIPDKILGRIEAQTYSLDRLWVNPSEVAQKVVEGLFDGVTTEQLDQLSVETAGALSNKHPDYAYLAARLAITNLYKKTNKSFSETVQKMYDYVNTETGEHAPLISEEFNTIVQENKDAIESAIVQKRDFLLDYLGFKTLEKSYLLKYDGQIIERPQYLFMRTAVGIHGRDIKSAIKTYNLISQFYYTHATPTLFNAGTMKPQLSSCFLLQMKDDSIDGIYDTLKQCAKISQSAGGIGVSISNIRAQGSYIKGTNGVSNGIIPMLRVYNDTARYVDQGGGKRKGSFAMYLEPWHADIFDFLDLRKNNGKEEMRTRDLFTAIWMPDLFMQRVEQDLNWSLMCPNESPGLTDVYGAEFVELYEKYEAAGKWKKQVKARDIWKKILESQIETGTPYIAYKDSVNIKSNQKNIGVIKNSNLCIEIVEYVSPDEVAVCNLASLCLPRFVKDDGTFNFDKLEEVAYTATVNLNKVIDINYYPIEEAKNSNLKHRPIGLGIQGLADVFFKLQLPFASEEAKTLNKQIFETIYYGAVKASCDIAKKDGPYSTFAGSPASQGILQFDMWNVVPEPGRYDWDALKEKVKQYGLRNSLLTCAMPTASTASVFGNEASCEAQTSNLYTRRVLSGEFIVVNNHLVRLLCEKGMWNENMRNEITKGKGSIQHINSIPTEIREVYKTVWEISQKTIIDLYADRGAYMDQTQSMNIYMNDPTFVKMNAMHFYGWGNGVTPSDLDPKYGTTPEKALKTGMYYLRSKTNISAVQFTVDQTKPEVIEEVSAPQCLIDNPDCEACGA